RHGIALTMWVAVARLARSLSEMQRDVCAAELSRRGERRQPWPFRCVTASAVDCRVSPRQRKLQCRVLANGERARRPSSNRVAAPARALAAGRGHLTVVSIRMT